MRSVALFVQVQIIVYDSAPHYRRGVLRIPEVQPRRNTLGEHRKLIHNIELRPGQGAAMVRSAGAFAQLAAREGNHAIIRLPSGETRMVLVTCRATVGTVSNPDHNLESHGKAGRNRWLGRRPRNRGVVMNPVDHPMGGGEGRASGGHPRSRKGLPAKGYKTRNPKSASNRFIIERRKK